MMLKINLLPPEVRPEENKVLPRLFRLHVWVVTVILGFVLLMVGLQVWVHFLESRQAEMTYALRQAEKSLSEREEVLVKAAALQEKINGLREIETGKDWSCLITDIGNTVPEDVWLSKIELQSDGTVALNGGSLTHSSIGDFITSLNGVSGVLEVTVKTVSSTEKGNFVVNEFEIVCLLEVGSCEG